MCKVKNKITKKIFEKNAIFLSNFGNLQIFANFFLHFYYILKDDFNK